MHGTFRTFGLIFLERTFLQALFDVIKEFEAFITKIVFTAVLAAAVKIYHQFDCVSFPLHDLLRVF